jgi:hypothetical protein
MAQASQMFFVRSAICGRRHHDHSVRYSAPGGPRSRASPSRRRSRQSTTWSQGYSEQIALERRAGAAGRAAGGVAGHAHRPSVRPGGLTRGDRRRRTSRQVLREYGAMVRARDAAEMCAAIAA